MNSSILEFKEILVDIPFQKTEIVSILVIIYELVGEETDTDESTVLDRAAAVHRLHDSCEINCYCCK